MSRYIKQIILVACMLVLNGHAWCQTAAKMGLLHHSFEDKRLGTVNFYITDTLHDRKKPVLIFLDGSGDRPLFFYKKDDKGAMGLYSSVPFDLKQMGAKYHVVLISKPNVRLIDTVSDNDGIISNPVYNKFASADWRVISASRVIDFVIKNYKTDRNKIAVLGYSEGGQVAPRVAVYNKKVTHCIAFVGGGLNQFFDQIIKYRLDAQKGAITHEEAQQYIDSLYAGYNDIYATPGATDKQWRGHSYLRWSSYTRIPTIEFYKQLDIPIFIAQGTSDENTNILSADYVQLEFARLHKNNLTYKVYPGYDHFFTNVTTHQNSIHEVIAASIDWLEHK